MCLVGWKTAKRFGLVCGGVALPCSWLFVVGGRVALPCSWFGGVIFWFVFVDKSLAKFFGFGILDSVNGFDLTRFGGR